MELLILPDNPAGVAVANLVDCQAYSQKLVHASGRPWIIGCWSDREVVRAEAGQRRAILLGSTLATQADLSDELGRVRDVREFDAMARSTIGSVHLIASLDGEVRAQGTASGVTQIFHTTLDGVTVAATRPDKLATLIGAGVDDALVAEQLMVPAPPWPLSEHCLWRGVERVPAGSALLLDRGGRVRTRTWWYPPAPDKSLQDGGAAVHAALSDAVAARTKDREVISADMSGGMDSTTLCFLTARESSALRTFRFGTADIANDDARWSARAAAHLSGVDHTVVSHDQLPTSFTDPLAPEYEGEAPFPLSRTRARVVHLARLYAESGSDCHLTGHGGDELFLSIPEYNHSILRASPMRSLRHIAAERAQRRWGLVSTLRQLADRTSYSQWLLATANALTSPKPRASSPAFGWGNPVRMPPWTTPDAVDAARSAMRLAADMGTPLAPERGQHITLQGARLCADRVRLVSQLTSKFGVSWDVPFLDDRVLEAALSVRFEDRATPGRYKPVLAQAMRGVVPDDLLGRPTKGEFSADVYAGLDANRSSLVALCDDMKLGQLGLVDPDTLRATLLAPHPNASTLIPLHNTLAAESWLRTVEPATAVPGGK